MRAMSSVEHDLTPATNSSRRSQRVRVRLEASAAPHGAAAAPSAVTVYNLSRDGFLTDARDGWSVGDALRVTLADVGTVAATIARAEQDVLGCVFVEPLSPAQLDRCMAASTIVWPDFVEPPGQAGRGAGQRTEAAEFLPEGWEKASDEPERWPRQVRAAIAIGGGLLLWGLIALAVF